MFPLAENKAHDLFSSGFELGCKRIQMHSRITVRNGSVSKCAVVGCDAEQKFRMNNTTCAIISYLAIFRSSVIFYIY